jgi:2-dehydro-3-deoxyphosphogluconate aldolase/(4S)-4-hydroxy-2-oxoglutarate aldolase
MDARARIEHECLIGIIRTTSADEAIGPATAALEAGLSIIEFTMNTPGALGLIERFADGPQVVGAGTVTDADEAESAIASGAQFIVTPVATRAVVDACRRQGVVVIPGASTPTEIWNAHRWGADLVKVFPIVTLGGAAYLRLLRGPFSEIPLLVTGGVDATNLAALYDAGAQIAGVTTSLFDPQLIARQDLEAIAARTGEFLAIRDRSSGRQAGRAPVNNP